MKLNLATTKRLSQGAFLLLLLLSAGYLKHQTPNEGKNLDELVTYRAHNAPILFTAEVIKLLADDNQGSRHQKFIVKSNFHTLLIAHNIDLAPRVPVALGDVLTIKGEYEWNDRGGVVHWTHHDPQNKQVGGWIELNGKKFK